MANQTPEKGSLPSQSSSFQFPQFIRTALSEKGYLPIGTGSDQRLWLLSDRMMSEWQDEQAEARQYLSLIQMCFEHETKGVISEDEQEGFSRLFNRIYSLLESRI